MNRKNLASLLWGSLFPLLFLACKAPEVKNHVEERGHEFPWSIEVLFTPGTAQDTTTLYAERFTPSGGETLSYTITTDDSDGTIRKPEPIRLAKNQWYKVNINFYNKAKVRLNAQYLTPEQASMHQFFFVCTRLKNTSQKYPSKIASQVIYKYMDVAPSGGERQPIGFEGVLRLKEELAYTDFNLRTQLVHVVPPATKKSKEGSYYPFDEPGEHLLGVTDIDLQIPIIVQE